MQQQQRARQGRIFMYNVPSFFCVFFCRSFFLHKTTKYLVCKTCHASKELVVTRVSTHGFIFFCDCFLCHGFLFFRLSVIPVQTTIDGNNCNGCCCCCCRYPCCCCCYLEQIIVFLTGGISRCVWGAGRGEPSISLGVYSTPAFFFEVTSVLP